MKNNFYRIILSLFVFGFFVLMDVFSQIVPYSGPGLVFPNNPPSSQEVNGGYFNSYFNNMFNATCPNGEVLIGFSSGATSTAPFKHDERWKPICVKFSASDGLASGFTGSMLGKDGSIPVYSSGGTILTGSFISQKWWNLEITFPNLNNNDPNSTGIIYFKDKNQNNIGYIGDGTTTGNKMQLIATNDSGLQLGIANNGISTWTLLEINPLTGDMNISSSNGINSTRFNILWKLKVLDWSQWSGKILTSDVNGVATWKNSSDVFSVPNEFLATGFTGSMIGSGRVLPMYNNSGNWLVNSIVSQNNDNNINVAWSLYVNSFSNNHADVAHFHRTNWNDRFGVSIYSYLSWTTYNWWNQNNEFLNWSTVIASTPNAKNFNISAFNSDAEIRFTIWWSQDPSSQKLKISKNGLIYPQGAGSGKVLMSDANGLARWETASLGGNPNDCSATNKSVNGHNYPIIGLTNGNSFLSNYIETITGGSRQWSQRFKCEKWYIITEGSEINSLVCNNGYISNGSACIQPSNDSKLGCSAMTMNVGGREYSVPAIAHNFSAYAYSSSNIDNGHINYKQLFACNNWTITTSGTEEATSTTCSAGFGWNGGSCVLSNNNDVVSAYSGTTCNTANIQVVNITPGIDKIPENLNADTMYKLEGGIYDITKKINFNTCSAMVGAGTGATTVQYSGLSYWSESLISSVKRDNIISNLKLSWKKQDNPWKAKHIISWSWSNRILRNLYLDNSTDYAIYWGVNLKASNIYFQDTDGWIYADNWTIENSSFHNFKNTKNDSYFNFLKKWNIINWLSFSSWSSNYVLKIDWADNVLNNVDFENITWTVLISSWENTISSGIFAKNIKLKNRDHLWLFVFWGKSKISNISIYDVLGDGTNNNALIIILSNNSALNNVLVGRLNLLTTYTYSSIIRSYDGNVSLNNFMANDIKYYKKWLFDFGSSTNSYINNVILSNINNMSWDDCVDFTWNNSIINNFIVSSTSKCWFSISWNNNTIKNFLSYKNRLHGIVLNGSNNTFSNVYSYANGGAGITGNGNSNFYYDKLQVFGNGWANNVGPLNRGLASHWLSGFNDGVLDTSGAFSPAWAISPTNVAGFNVNTVGYQAGLTWPENITWSFGASIPRQISPIIPSNCNLSTTSTAKCRPEFGGTDTYNSLKKIWEW